MGELRCVDGSILSVVAVACRDRAGKPYEITLEMARDHEPFGAVGERCGYLLSQLAAGVRAAREDPEQAEAWPDPDDRFPDLPGGHALGPHALGAPGSREPGGHGPGGRRVPGVRAARSLDRYLPGERDYLSLRARDRGDLPGRGELRCSLRASAEWLGECSGAGQQGPHGQHGPYGPHGPRVWPGGRAISGQHAWPGSRVTPGQPGGLGEAGEAGEAGIARRGATSAGGWRLTRRAVVEAWGACGTGVRAVLTSTELVTFLDTVLREPDGAVLSGSALTGAVTAGKQPGGISWPSWRQRGRVPDGTTRTRLPAVRAQARSVALAAGDSAARGSDVRR